MNALPDPQESVPVDPLRLLEVVAGDVESTGSAVDGFYVLARQDTEPEPGVFDANGPTGATTGAYRLIARHQAFSHEEVLRVAGRELALLTALIPLGESGESPGALGLMAIDVSERKRSELQMKESLERLRVALATAEKTNGELRSALEEVERAASIDRLTGVGNRRRLEELVAKEIDRFDRYGHPLSMLLIDIDHFKLINDDYGHVAGDSVLVETSGVISRCCRKCDSLARWGGEEFIVLAANTPLSSARPLAEKLRLAVEEHAFERASKVTVSLGVAEYQRGETWEEFFGRADAALYAAKHNGRNRVECSPETGYRKLTCLGGDVFLVQLVWREAYNGGEPRIDAQHQALFQDANELTAALLTERPIEEIAGQVDAFVDQVCDHFRDEEDLFRAARYPFAEEHAALHRDLIAKARNWAGEFKSGKGSVGSLVQFLASDLVANHILKADRHFFPYLAQPVPPSDESQTPGR